jgi:type IV pilus assembly protein PilV
MSLNTQMVFKKMRLKPGQKFLQPVVSSAVTTQGFSMIELLVAVVVVAIGLLGMAGLQTAGLSNNQSAYFRSQAIIAINDLTDRMRANTEGVTAGHYQISFDTDATPPNDPGCINSVGGCTPLQLSEYDIREWTQLFRNIKNENNYIPLLPGANGQITYSEPSPDQGIYTIIITWQEITWATGGTKQAQAQDMRVNIAL